MPDPSLVTKLDGVHPALVRAYNRISYALAELGFPIMVTDGVRTQAQQQALYAQGRTTPGKIVTRCDGVIKKSNHQVKADGFCHAIDCAFLVNGEPSWAEILPWRLYGEAAKSQGLEWGGDWPTRKIDRPHIQLPASAPNVLHTMNDTGADIPGGGASG